MNLIESLDHIRSGVDSRLHSLLRRSRTPAPIITDAVGYALQAGGKRIRPALCVFAGELGGVQRPLLLDLSLCLEILHTYSLVHDDLPCMDDANLRRGKPTLHKQYDEAMATLAGDAMLTLAWESLIHSSRQHGLSDGDTLTSVLELSGAVGMNGMIGGQILDLQGEQTELDEVGLRQLHLHKTGCLFVASLRLGGRAAKLTSAELEALARYGKSFGLVFQITDDLLDAFSNSQQLGKTSGRDEHHKKSTYVTVFGEDQARRMARQEADQACAQLQEFVKGSARNRLEDLVMSLLKRKF